MIKEPKLHKSLRLDTKIIDIIENYRGETFVQKFENLVYDCIIEVENKRAEVKKLSEIEEKKLNEIEHLSLLINSAEQINSEMTRFTETLKRVNTRTEKYN